MKIILVLPKVIPYSSQSDDSYSSHNSSRQSPSYSQSHYDSYSNDSDDSHSRSPLVMVEVIPAIIQQIILVDPKVILQGLLETAKVMVVNQPPVRRGLIITRTMDLLIVFQKMYTLNYSPVQQGMIGVAPLVIPKSFP